MSGYCLGCGNHPCVCDDSDFTLVNTVNVDVGIVGYDTVFDYSSEIKEKKEMKTEICGKIEVDIICDCCGKNLIGYVLLNTKKISFMIRPCETCSDKRQEVLK